jgi:plasmid stability protein
MRSSLAFQFGALKISFFEFDITCAETPMAQLLVRNVSDTVKERLRRRASSNGRSLESEVREILTEASVSSKTVVKGRLGTRLARKQAPQKLTKADWDAFEKNLKELRRNWRVKDADFGK